jgi:hypothetical protein
VHDLLLTVEPVTAGAPVGSSQINAHS